MLMFWVWLSFPSVFSSSRVRCLEINKTPAGRGQFPLYNCRDGLDRGSAEQAQSEGTETPWKVCNKPLQAADLGFHSHKSSTGGSKAQRPEPITTTKEKSFWNPFVTFHLFWRYNIQQLTRHVSKWSQTVATIAVSGFLSSPPFSEESS